MFRSSLFVLAAAAIVVTSMAGCGGSEATVEGKLDSVKGKLVGKWELDTEALREAMKGEMEAAGKSEDDTAATNAAMMDSMFDKLKMSMEFQQGGKLIVAMSSPGQEKSDEGVWEVVSVDGNSVMLRMTDGKEKDETNKVLLVDDDTLELYPPDGEPEEGGMQKVILKRVK